MKNRTLKVRSGHYPYRVKKESLHQRIPEFSVPPPVPFVLIKGYWLEKINFTIGTILNVEVEENKLTLTVASD